MDTEILGIISRYTRKQAIKDGVLVDVSTWAKEVGICVPVAVTSALWARLEAIPEAYCHEDTIGRLWDLLSMLRAEIRKTGGGIEIVYGMTLHEHEDKKRSELAVIRAVSGPGDDREHVITIMGYDED